MRLNNEEIKIETEKDYLGNSKVDIDWCKKHLVIIKANHNLPTRYSHLIKKKLYNGIQITNIETGIEVSKRFDYPLKYIQNVMNLGIKQWNKWVILCALDFCENELEYIYKLSINDHSISPKLHRRKRIIKAETPREYLIKRHKLTAPIVNRSKKTT